MNKESNTLTRREAMLRVLKSAAIAAVAAPVVVQAAPAVLSAPTEPEFVPENDYPFFGYEPDTML